jgi:hypothetical protein
MKKFYFSVCLVLAALLIEAQTPAGFSYQAVIRNETGELVKNKTIGVRFTILKGSENGAQVYSEVIYPQTNINGLVTAEIGKSNPTQFSQIDWSAGIYYLKTETDLNGGTNYSISGTSQLLSVPYALYSAKSGDAFSGNYNDLSNKPVLSTVATTGNYSDLLNKPVLSTVATTGNYSDLLGKPNLATIATTGSFTDLLNVPILVTLLKNPQAGDILYNNGTNWELLTRGINGQTLRLDNGMPKWAEPGYALPLVTTLPVTDIMMAEATSGGNIVNTGFTEVTARGVCWSTSQNPTTADSKTSEGVGTGGSFNSKMTGLQANTTYYVRAYATNGAGTGYGNQLSFKTYQTIVFPTITTTTASNVSATTASSGGNITETGGAPVTARGICWSTNQNPTTTDSKTTEGNNTGQFASQAINLLPGTTYYIKAYATNSSGTGYGNQVTVTTTKTVPVITTKAITDISAMGGVSGGTIVGTGGSNITEKGICWGENPNPTISDNVINSGTGQAAFTSAIIKALPNTTYYVRAYAKNELGVGYGDEKSFKTSEVSYFQSFEAGVIPTGWTGPWNVTNEKSYDGNYSLKSLKQDCDASIKVNVNQNGYLYFYYFITDGTIGLDIYIDNVKVVSYPTDNNQIWKQARVDIPAGNHEFKWHFDYSWGNGLCYIDYIVITK